MIYRQSLKKNQTGTDGSDHQTEKKFKHGLNINAVKLAFGFFLKQAI